MRSIAQGLNTSYEAEKVSTVFRQKKSTQSLLNLWRRFSFGFLLSVILLYDIYSQAITRSLGLDFVIIWAIEVCLAVLTTLFSVAELFAFLYQSFFPQYVDITDSERKLLGVRDGEPGFRKSPQATPQSTPSRGIKFSPTSYNPNTQISPNISLSPSMRGVTSGSPVQMDESVHSISSMSPSFSNSFHNRSVNRSYTALDESLPVLSVRHRMSPTRNLSPNTNNSFMTSHAALDNYLTEEYRKENRDMRVNAEMNSSTASSFWSINRTVMDSVPILRNLRYQMGTVPPQKAGNSGKPKDSQGSSAEPTQQEFFNMLGASRAEVDLWIENLRYWLGQTIMQRYAHQLEKLEAVTHTDVAKNGKRGVVKEDLLALLDMPYDKSDDKKYLIQRIKELGRGGCIAAYDWNYGSPEDCKILMHAFCTYMDQRLPANLRYWKKTFSKAHYITDYKKPEAITASSDLLNSLKLNHAEQKEKKQLHYNIIIGHTIRDVPKGRNNLFYALLLFLYEIKKNRSGMLGNVSFGPAGVNMMWIMTHKYR